jgi:hypothetical protein
MATDDPKFLQESPNENPTNRLQRYADSYAKLNGAVAFLSRRIAEFILTTPDTVEHEILVEMNEESIYIQKIVEATRDRLEELSDEGESEVLPLDERADLSAGLILLGNFKDAFNHLMDRRDIFLEIFAELRKQGKDLGDDYDVAVAYVKSLPQYKTRLGEIDHLEILSRIRLAQSKSEIVELCKIYGIVRHTRSAKS